MYVEEAIAKLLRSDKVAAIDFDLNGLHITGAGYSRVAGLIEKGHIKVKVDHDFCANGGYDPDNNRLILGTKKISNIRVRRTVVHEATHALCDLAPARGYVYVEESAGFLAGEIYAKRAGLLMYRSEKVARNFPKWCEEVHDEDMRRAINEHRRLTGKRPRPTNRPIDDGAVERIHRAAHDLINRFGLDQNIPRRTRLSWKEFAALRDAVASAGAYEYRQLPTAPFGPPNRYRNDGIARHPDAFPAHNHVAE